MYKIYYVFISCDIIVQFISGTSINAQYAYYAQYMLTDYCLKMPSDSSKCISTYIYDQSVGIFGYTIWELLTSWEMLSNKYEKYIIL